MSDHVWLIILSCLVVWLGYQVNELREARKPRLKPKVLKALLWSDPIAVKHHTPRSLTPDGKERFGADKHDFEVFQAFWYFADWINKLYADLSEPFRLQELGNTDIKGSASDYGPAYGRRYDIFYNQCKIGLLEISANRRRDQTVDVEITINQIPPTTLSHSSVYGFLQTVASLVADTDRPKYDHLPDGETEYEYALSEIRTAIARLMWEMHQDDNLFPELKVELSGYPEHYYHLLQLKYDQDNPKAAAQ